MAVATMREEPHTGTYNMRDLSDAVSLKFGMSSADSARIARFMFDTLSAKINEGKQVRLHLFGTFQARVYYPVNSRNPSTGEQIEMPVRRLVRFRPSEALKNRIDKGTLAALKCKPTIH